MYLPLQVLSLLNRYPFSHLHLSPTGVRSQICNAAQNFDLLMSHVSPKAKIIIGIIKEKSIIIAIPMIREEFSIKTQTIGF